MEFASLTPDQLERVCPSHLIIDAEGCLRGIGSGLRDILTGLRIGTLSQEVFEFSHGACGAGVVLTHRETGTHLHGEIVRFGDSFAFLAELPATSGSAEEQASLFQALLETSVDAILVVDPVRNKVLIANQAFYRLMGYQPEDLPGLQVTDVLPARRSVRQQIETTSRRGGRIIGEVTWRRRDGSPLQVRLSVAPGRWQERLVLILLGYDVIESEAALRGEQENHEEVRRESLALQLYQRVAHHMRLGLHVWQTNGSDWVLLACNPAGASYLAGEADSMLEQPMHTCVPQLAASLLPSVLAEVLQDAQPRTLEDVPFQSRLLTLSAFPIGDQRVGVTIEDVTERRATEAALRDRETQLSQAQKMEAVGRLAGGVAHDFNNILTAVLGYAGVVASELPPEVPLHEEVREIQRAAERASALTRQLLTFSRRRMTQPRLLDVPQAVVEVSRMLERIIGEDVRLVLALEPSTPRVFMDCGHLEQILLNLAVNARDAMPQGGTVTIASRGEGDQVVLEVSDTGHGMSEQVAARIFEPFFSTKLEGTGLGLSTVHDIVNSLGGKISVTTRPDEGATFVVHLPAHEGRLEPPRLESRAAPGRRERVLVVEDDGILRDLTCRILQRSGYEVLQAANGTEAMSLFDKARVHLVLSDVVMPVMSGLKLVSTLRSRHPHLPVLLMSGYADRAQSEVALAPDVPLIHKPFTPESLLKHVRRALDNPW
ncbi:MAG: hybrid sensor histidine kinase/response regulator [Candidatus Xenobia bacterium]